MDSRLRRALVGGAACLAWTSPLSAQIAVVVNGRVEDAVSREPLPAVRVFAPDSSAAALTDSLGAFSLPLPTNAPLAVRAERLGYLAQRFQLGEEASSQISVLLLEPAPIELEEISVVDDATISVLIQGLENRRNAFPSAMRAFDRAQLERFAPVGSVWDFVRTRNPWFFECRGNLSHICVRGRSPTFRNPFPESRVRICLDGWSSLAPASELSTLDISSVALVEFYARQEVRIYTAEYILSRARRGQTQVPPLWMGC